MNEKTTVGYHEHYVPSEQESLWLLALKDNRTRIKKLTDERAILRQVWWTWKFHYRKESWYREFILTHGVALRNAERYEDILGDKFKVSDQPAIAQQEGSMVLVRMRLIGEELASMAKQSRELTDQLWRSEVPLKAIAEAYGASENATYVYISRGQNFRTRRALSA